MITFPEYSDSSAAGKISDLVRLMDRSLTNTQYIDGRRASRLLGVMFQAYRDAAQSGNFGDQRLQQAFSDGTLFNLTLSAAFDLVTNAEYLHGRVVNSRWIYCHRSGEAPRAYYSFLKQCPACCLDHGLEKRLQGAQHKPTSHHIGEITTVVTALILELLATANEEPLAIATITKQSHDVDVIGFREGLLLLFEIKASPMVTFPLIVDLKESLQTDIDGELTEYAQHSLVDMPIRDVPISLAIPHRSWSIPLGPINDKGWPYDQLTQFMREPGNFLRYLSAWQDLYEAYRIPKTRRTPKQMALTYLVNGWGDEIDSNKTKPGLGRTDDIKKGTYQLLKFGAYYRDDSSSLKVRGALVANLDPLFLREGYLDSLLDVRWGRRDDFRLVEGEYRIRPEVLKYLYDGIVAFNRPTINDETMKSVFDLPAVNDSLVAGKLDPLLTVWTTEGPDAAVDDAVEGVLF
ncbi:hypothetical protein L6E12_19070 [Actinokineospora sp. PR83]|uniref:hypothetical protein n=1 Tax=Actinokineospora sp. PR83 TaxID=2884908 RepID=UPI001F1D8A8C|nr:hypothetical protein [Actinokineospora sp. PR83]MCG8917886.1 hypothetical protein [Actinokineospora sp. PR83]